MVTMVTSSRSHVRGVPRYRSGSASAKGWDHRHYRHHRHRIDTDRHPVATPDRHRPGETTSKSPRGRLRHENRPCAPRAAGSGRPPGGAWCARGDGRRERNVRVTHGAFSADNRVRAPPTASCRPETQRACRARPVSAPESAARGHCPPVAAGQASLVPIVAAGRHKSPGDERVLDRESSRRGSTSTRRSNRLKSPFLATNPSRLARYRVSEHTRRSTARFTKHLSLLGAISRFDTGDR